MPTPKGADRLLWLAALAMAGLFVLRAAIQFKSPLTVEYGEGTTWAYARLLETHGTYFLPIAEAPWIHGTYPPLFPWLHHLLGGSLRAGRLVALLAGLGAAAALAAILRAHGVTGRRALLWAVLFLCTPVVHEWSSLCRVDTLALALTLAGVAVLARFPRMALASAALFALAFFAKQVALAGPAAATLWLLRRGEKRRALMLAVGYAVLVGSGLAVLQARTSGESFRHLVTYASVVGPALTPLVVWGLRFLFRFPVLLPLGFSRLRSLAGSIAGVYGVAALLTLALAAKPGAASNYLLEPTAGVFLLGALAAERRRAEVAHDLDRRKDFVLLLVVQAVVLCDPGRLLEGRDLLREQSETALVVAELQGAPGPVLADDLGFTLAAGKEPMLEPFQFALLAKAARFDPAPVLARLDARAFAMVAEGPRLRELPGLSLALAGSYEVKTEVGVYRIWVPKATEAKRPR